MRAVPVLPRKAPMNPLLYEVIEQSRAVRPTQAERDVQKMDFAYGNARFENPLVTREMVRRAFEQLYHPETPERG